MPIVKTIPGGSSISLTDQFAALQKRVTACQMQRAGKEKELELCKKQYEDIVAQIQAAGIDDVDALPAKLAEMQEQLRAQVADVDQQVTKVEEAAQALK